MIGLVLGSEFWNIINFKIHHVRFYTGKNNNAKCTRMLPLGFCKPFMRLPLSENMAKHNNIMWRWINQYTNNSKIGYFFNHYSLAVEGCTFNHIFILYFLFLCYLLAPSAETGNDLSAWVGEELNVSDRPELTSAKVVVSGGRFCYCSHSSMMNTCPQGLEGYFRDSGSEQNIWCGIRENTMYLNQKRYFTAICTQELGFTKM